MLNLTTRVIDGDALDEATLTVATEIELLLDINDNNYDAAACDWLALEGVDADELMRIADAAIRGTHEGLREGRDVFALLRGLFTLGYALATVALREEGDDDCGY